MQNVARVRSTSRAPLVITIFMSLLVVVDGVGERAHALEVEPQEQAPGNRVDRNAELVAHQRDLILGGAFGARGIALPPALVLAVGLGTSACPITHAGISRNGDGCTSGVPCRGRCRGGARPA